MKQEEWEAIEIKTERLRVVGGWLVRTWRKSPAFKYPHPTSVAMVFVPDRLNEWK